MKAEIIFFSATGATKKIIEALAQGLNCETCYTDITLPKNRKAYKPTNSDVMIFASPIYGERIPRFVYDFFKQVRGNGKPLIGISVYGNVGYGFSLVQFKDLARENDFCLIAAGAFIGEHTYANKKTPVGLNRPSEDDLTQAREFGKKINKKVCAGDFTPVAIPKPTLPKFVSDFPDTGTRILIRQPAVDKAVCNHCGACVKRCPVGAIDPHSLRIDERRCLRCYACVKVCSVSARTVKFRLWFFEKIFGCLGRKHKENLMVL